MNFAVRQQERGVTTQYIAILMILMTACWCVSTADEGGQAAKLTSTKSLQGRWGGFQEEKLEGKNIRRRIVLDINESTIDVSFSSDIKKWSGALRVNSVETVSKLWAMPEQVARITVDREQIYCDMVGNELFVVGRICHLPWEGGALSGAYKRDIELKK